MSLEALRAMVPPPREPVDAAGSWASVEDKLGTKLPGDYQAYIGAYGTGCLDDFIWVLNPFSSDPHVDLLARGQKLLDGLRWLQSRHGHEMAYPLFPAAGGLLPWGTTENGDMLFWLTMGPPDEWSVVVNEARGPETEQHPGGATEFLARVLKREIVCGIFPDDFPEDEHSFAVR